MKNLILQKIYDSFETWEKNRNFVCQKGCATCCTQNVTITAVEANKIFHYILKNNKEQWFAKCLENISPLNPPKITTNEYATACLSGEEVDPGNNDNYTPCPFLQNNSCTIYSVRPFGCRCFGSNVKCSIDHPAEAPEFHLAASTSIYQIIEHMSQGEYWGNMLDVLLAMCGMREYESIRKLLFDDTLIKQSKDRLLKARPLPGFLLLEEDQKHVGPLLDMIFTTKIDHRTIEEILNGK